jgi:hypothetical protein
MIEQKTEMIDHQHEEEEETIEEEDTSKLELQNIIQE